MPDYTMGGATARDVWTYTKRFTTSMAISDEVQVAADNERIVYTDTYKTVKRVQFGRTGYARIKWEFHIEPEGFTAYTRLYINGNPVGAEHSTGSTSYVQAHEDVSLSAGDLIELKAKANDWSVPTFVRNFRICYSDLPEYIVLLD